MYFLLVSSEQCFLCFQLHVVAYVMSGSQFYYSILKLHIDSVENCKFLYLDVFNQPAKQIIGLIYSASTENNIYIQYLDIKMSQWWCVK